MNEREEILDPFIFGDKMPQQAPVPSMKVLQRAYESAAAAQKELDRFRDIKKRENEMIKSIQEGTGSSPMYRKLIETMGWSPSDKWLFDARGYDVDEGADPEQFTA